MRYTMMSPDHMNTSPCAKLMSLRMPYTIVYPMAISAYCPPTAMPARIYGNQVCNMLLSYLSDSRFYGWILQKCGKPRGFPLLFEIFIACGGIPHYGYAAG